MDNGTNGKPTELEETQSKKGRDPERDSAGFEFGLLTSCVFHSNENLYPEGFLV